MSDIQLKSFPSTNVEALTMLYLQNQDLSKITPAELAQKYKEVQKEIQSEFSSNSKQQIRT
jgi:hypothetical protein